MSVANIKTLKEIILDEKRLVTYISLSKELCLHVNEVKILLKKIIEDLKETRPEIVLNVHYIVAGLSKGHGARITVCSEGELKETIKSFKTVFFHHVYSICQGSSSVDNTIFTLTNNFENFPLCVGLIKGTTCAKRSSDEIGTLKTNSQDAIKDSNTKILPRKDTKNNTNNNESKKENDVSKIKATKSELTVSNKLESAQKTEVQTTNKRNGGVSNGIVGFFSRASTKKSNSDNKTHNEDIKVSNSKTEVKIEAMDVDEIDTKKKPINGLELNTKDSEVKVKKEQKNDLKTKKEETSTVIVKKNAKVDRKRKRVLHVSDSESDEDKNDPFVDVHPNVQDSSDDEIPPTPSTDTVKITSGIVNPKKRRKVVDKTYTDEDGYILTRKEEVYESCSDNENEKSTMENTMLKNFVKTEVSPTQNKIKTSKKKTSPPQKGKQASIMSFFQKK